MRIAYLVDGYPAINHTFVLREVVALRSKGFDVDVVALHGADRPPEAMTELERAELKRTFNILPFGSHVVKAHLSTLLRKPFAYLGGLLYALRLGSKNDLKGLIMHLAYFAEAIVGGHRIESLGIRHFHTHFSSTLALIASRIFGMTYSMTIHGPAEFDDVIGFHLPEKVANFSIRFPLKGRSSIPIRNTSKKSS